MKFVSYLDLSAFAGRSRNRDEGFALPIPQESNHTFPLEPRISYPLCSEETKVVCCNSNIDDLAVRLTQAGDLTFLNLSHPPIPSSSIPLAKHSLLLSVGALSSIETHSLQVSRACCFRSLRSALARLEHAVAVRMASK